MAAAALTLVLLLGVSPNDSSEGATAHVIDGVTTFWSDYMSPVELFDGDSMTILAAAGSPSGDFVLQFAPNANVTINGAGNVINNLRLVDGTDTAEHTITLNNLKIATTGGEGYFHDKGVLNLIGNNSINANTNTGIYSTSTPVMIKSTTGGTLIVSSTAQRAISATGFNIIGNASVHVSAGAAVPVIDLGGASITVDVGATLGLVNNNPLPETHTFCMGSSGNQWVLSVATLVAPSTVSSDPANIRVAGNATGIIQLASQPGIVGPSSGSLTVGYGAIASTDVFTITGSPAPVVTLSSTEPKFSWNNTTKKIEVQPGLAAGTYTATLTASNGFTPSATKVFTLTVTASGITGVTVNPTTADVQKGTTKTFTATVAGTGSPAQTVTWTVTGAAAAGTTISSAGVLTVASGETATTLTVTAKSTVDISKSGTATVTVKEASGGGGGGGSNTALIIVVVVVVLLAVVGVFFFMKMKGKP